MRWRIYLSLVLLCLVLTFVVQNTETVDFNFLFWSFGLPRALMLLVVFIGGVATGLLWVASRGQRFTGVMNSKSPAGSNESPSKGKEQG